MEGDVLCGKLHVRHAVLSALGKGKRALGKEGGRFLRGARAGELVAEVVGQLRQTLEVGAHRHGRIGVKIFLDVAERYFNIDTGDRVLGSDLDRIGLRCQCADIAGNVVVRLREAQGVFLPEKHVRRCGERAGNLTRCVFHRWGECDISLEIALGEDVAVRAGERIPRGDLRDVLEPVEQDLDIDRDGGINSRLCGSFFGGGDIGGVSAAHCFGNFCKAADFTGSIGIDLCRYGIFGGCAFLKAGDLGGHGAELRIMRERSGRPVDQCTAGICKRTGQGIFNVYLV